jgi:EmrB/QacA subfamily drug resistance transporter
MTKRMTKLNFDDPRPGTWQPMKEQSRDTTKTWVLLLASVASLMAALDAMVVTTALGTIRVDLGASIEALEWTVNAYNLTFAVLLLTGAALGDRWGRRRMFAAGLGLFVAASAACALAGNVGWLIAARAVQGAGAALVMPLAMALLSAAFPPEERGKALGIFSGVTGLALIAGPVMGGAIAGGLAWQWIFWINIPIGLIAIPLALGRIPESFGSVARLDIGGLILVTGAALAIVWGLMRGNDVGWADAEIIAVMLAGVVLAVAFVAWELRAGEPMVPMRLFRAHAFSSGVAASFLFYASMYGVVFFLPQFFQTAQGLGPLGAGLRLLPWTATLFVFAPIGGALVNRLGERPLVVVGLLMQALGFAWIGVIAASDLSFAHLVAPLILAGAGVSMAMPAAQNAVLGAVAAGEVGKASGIFNMARFLGGVFGIALAVAVFAATGSVGSPHAFGAGFISAISASAALSLMAAIAALALPGKRIGHGPGKGQRVRPAVEQSCPATACSTNQG